MKLHVNRFSSKEKPGMSLSRGNIENALGEAKNGVGELIAKQK